MKKGEKHANSFLGFEWFRKKLLQYIMIYRDYCTDPLLHSVLIANKLERAV